MIEPVTLISCVAALIQAFDSGIRILDAIKEKRRERKAALPPKFLEESLRAGKQDVSRAFEDGNRWADEPVVEDNMPKLLSIYQIVTLMQSEMLQKLTLARNDDEFNDFDTIYRLSEQGRYDALSNLYQLFSPHVQNKFQNTSPTGLAVYQNENPEQAQTTTSDHPEQSENRRSYTYKRRRSNAPSQEVPLSPGSRRPRNLPSNSSQRTLSQSSASGTASSKDGSPRRASCIEIQSFGGTCKYAHKLRENELDAGMQICNEGALLTNSYAYVCKSTKCVFRIPAIKNGNSWEIGDTAKKCHAIDCRWIFLAKSHIAQEDRALRNPYMCLLCVILRGESAIYNGRAELMLHISKHPETHIGDVPLEGKLKFTNRGIERDENFDIDLPPIESRPQPLDMTRSRSFPSSEECFNESSDVGSRGGALKEGAKNNPVWKFGEEEEKVWTVVTS